MTKRPRKPQAKRRSKRLPIEVRADLVLKAIIAASTFTLAVLSWKLVILFSLILGGLSLLLQ